MHTFLETNYIDPVIKKLTQRHMKKTSDIKYKCGACHKEFDYSELTAVKYPNNKQILRCPECMKKYKRRY